jgi:hypothetical protein
MCVATTLVLGAIGLPALTTGRLTENWSDSEVFEKADLVVVAIAGSTSNTRERISLALNPPVPVTGIETEFEVRIVLKGSPAVRKLRLHYYKSDEEFTNGPWLIEIPKDKHPTYLLFLIREPDGRYAPATNQIDPAGSAVFRISAANRRGPGKCEPAIVASSIEKRWNR